MYHRYTAGGNIKFLKKDFPLDLLAPLISNLEKHPPQKD